MNSPSLLLIAAFFLALLSCKDVPVFDDSINNPDTENYVVRPIKEFKVLTDFSDREGIFYINYPSQFPFTGFAVEVRNELEDSDFEPFATFEDPQIIGDSTYYLTMPEPPFVMNEFRVRAFYTSEEYGEVYSSPLNTTLRQFLYFQPDYTFAADSISGEFYHSFLTNFHLTVYNQVSPDEKVVILDKSVSAFHSIDAEFKEEELKNGSLSYTVTPLNSSSSKPHEFSLEYSQEKCITKVDDFLLFTPTQIDYSRRWYENNLTIRWNNQCDISEFYVYQDDRGSVREQNIPIPLVEIGRYETTDGSGNIQVPLKKNPDRDSYQIWLKVVHNGTHTEFTQPYVLSY